MSLLDGLVSAWTLDEASGTRKDSQGTNDLTDNGAVGSAAGKNGNAAQFTGSAGQALTSASATLRIGNGSATINMWANFSANRTYDILVWKNEGPLNFSYIAYRYHDNADQLRLEYQDTAGYKAFNNTIFGSLALNTWYMLTLRFNLAGNELAIFVNGGSKTTNTFSGFGTNNTGEAAWRLGDDNGDLNAGLIDEVGFWNRALSDAEIAEIYNSGIGTFWPFDEESSSSSSSLSSSSLSSSSSSSSASSSSSTSSPSSSSTSSQSSASSLSSVSSSSSSSSSSTSSLSSSSSISSLSSSSSPSSGSSSSSTQPQPLEFGTRAGASAKMLGFSSAASARVG